MSEEPPEGWRAVRLQEAIHTLQTGPFGSALHRSDYVSGGIPLINPSNIRSGRLVPDPEITVSADVARRLPGCVMRPGDVVVARRGEMGRAALVTPDRDEWFCGTGSAFIRPGAAVDSSFLAWWFGSPAVRSLLQEASVGATMSNLSVRIVGDLALALPPLAEQRRIVEKVEALLAEVNAVRDRLARVPEILKRFRQAVLTAAMVGRLTEGWRRSNSSIGSGADVTKRDGDRKSRLLRTDPSLGKKKSTIECQINDDFVFEIPKTWAFTTWGSLSEWVTYGFTRPMPHSESGVRLVTAKDVHPFDVRLASANRTPPKAFNDLSEKDRPRQGDLLLTKDGSIGRAALVKTDEPFCINQSVAVCWLRSTEMAKPFLEMVANAEYTQAFIREKAQGMAIQHLSIIDFAQCPVPVPPVPEQQEIVRRVRVLFELAADVEARCTTALESTRSLTQSILAKAFRGELVPTEAELARQEGRDYEPASVLIERIKVEREKATAEKLNPARQPRAPAKQNVRASVAAKTAKRKARG